MALRPTCVGVGVMSRVISVAVVCATLVVAGCMTVTRLQPEEPAPPIEVAVPVPTAEAFRRTLSAFAAEGLTVAQAEESGGVIASAPVAGDMMIVGGLEVVRTQVYLIYRANVIAGPDGTSVVRLTLWSRGQMHSSSGTEEIPETQAPASCATHPRCRDAWARLERIAERLRAAA